MIGQSKSMNMLSGKQSSIRHKVRNLRAKVRTLVPNIMCGKYQKRNLDLQNLENNRKMYQTLHSGKSWNRCPIPNKTQNYFYDKKKSGVHLYSKLKFEEIEQINQDKIYYLGGDEHIEVYDQYVYDNYPSQSMGLAGLGLKINENKKSDKNTKGMSSLKNFSTQLPPPSTNYLGSPKGSTNLQKHSSVFLEKKKFIEDELKIQTAYNKMRLNEKLQKAEVVHRQGRYRVYSQHKSKRRIEQNRQEEAKKRRKKIDDKGDIALMNNELRQIFINKLKKQNKNSK